MLIRYFVTIRMKGAKCLANKSYGSHRQYTPYFVQKWNKNKSEKMQSFKKKKRLLPNCQKKSAELTRGNDIKIDQV